jgi:hypothetical protein
VACLALTALVAAQLALPARTELPQNTDLAPRRGRAPAAAPIPAYAILAGSNVFSPDRADAGGGSLGDCAVVGVISVGRRSAAVVRAGGGGARVVAPGDGACGGRLARIDRASVTFERDGRRQVLPVGAAPQPASAAPPQSQGEEPSQ